MLQPRTGNKSASTEEIKLDKYGCLSLSEIIKCFNAPISEEHAWAVIYQTLRTLDNCIKNLHVIRQLENVVISEEGGSPKKRLDSPIEARVPDELLGVYSTDDILIQEDGFVHDYTWRAFDSYNSQRKQPQCASGNQRSRNSHNSRRRGRLRSAISSENKAIAEFGIVIYKALDSGLHDDQERKLSPQLEQMIESMTSTTGDDEGIESDQYDTELEEPPSLDQNQRYQLRVDLNNDSESYQSTERDEGFCSSGTCTRLLQVCARQLSTKTEAESHFRAVCRALVSEALELSSFIQRVSKYETEVGEELIQEMALQDWARNFRQVLQDLRSARCKLKSVNHTKTPIEYELTPYEMLMENIRSRRYTLNKVATNEECPVKVENAHDLILHFIRSRPHLKPVNDRQLKPHRKESTPVELLMESIRHSSARSSLRKTKGPPIKSLSKKGKFGEINTNITNY